MRRPLRLLLLSLLVLVAGCGDDTDVRTGDQPSGPADEPGPADGGGAGDATQVAIAIEVGGGFVPVGYDFTSVPTVVLDNGTAFTAGAMTMQYPGPAVAPVMTGLVDPDVLDELLEAATDAGLATDEELDAGQPPVADVPSTTITVRIDGQRYEHSIYGLSSTEDGGADLGLTEAQVALRRALSAFVTDVTDAVAQAAYEPYEPEAYEVRSIPTAGGDPDVPPNRLEWPLDTPIAGDGGCQAVAGDDAVALAAQLAEATQITVWTDPGTGTEHQLAIRAVLPGYDRDC